MWSNSVESDGQLIIVSGPSGAGKSTVLRKLLRTCPLPLEMSVSVTTRSPRPGEIDGRDYHFVTREQFQHMRSADAFLECKEVFGRDWYGTPAKSVDAGLASGKWMVLEIDVRGALSVMEKRSGILSFFIHPGSIEELRQRLVSRNTDGEEAVMRRLEVAQEELKAITQYRYEIVNKVVDNSVKDMCEILEKHSLGANHA